MKLNFTIVFFAALSILVSCIPQELDNIQAFRYKFPELEEITPLPAVELSLPPAVEVSLGGILIGRPADELVKDVVAAVIDKDITEENLIVIDRFSKISPEISTDELKVRINEEWIVGVLSGTIQPAPDLIRIAQIFKADPDMVKYLSQLEYPQIDGFTVRGRISFPDPVSRSIPLPESFKISTLVTPCKEAAEELYLNNVEELKQQAVQQNSKVLQHYDSLRTQAVSGFNQRIAVKDSIIGGNLDLVNDFVVFFNESVDLLEYPDEVKRGLKIYIVAYVVEVRDQLVEYVASYELFAQLERDRKLELINFEQADAEFTIKENLTNAIEKQKVVYNTALNNCHNQGAGG